MSAAASPIVERREPVGGDPATTYRQREIRAY